MYPPYELLKNLISSKQVSESLLEDLKAFFYDDIGFRRKLFCIKSISDLIYILECQDIVSEYNIQGLEDIAGELGDKTIEHAIANYVQNDYISNENQYALQRLKDENNENETRFNNNSLIEDDIKDKNLNKVSTTAAFKNACFSTKFIGEKRNDVFKLIAGEIGAKWRDFGRELGIRESEMDTLELDYPKDVKTRTYKILEKFESDACEEKQDYVTRICDALFNARRRDLSIDVRKIMGG